MDAYVLDYVRTPRGLGRDKGSLAGVAPIELLRQLLVTLADRNALETANVADLILGCVTQTGEQGADLARIALLHAGWDQGVAGMTLNRFCASGLSACGVAAQSVHAGSAQLAIGGGVESMSRVPMMSDGGAWYSDPAIRRSTGFVHMGVAADLVATLQGFSREALDGVALESHRRAALAERDGRHLRSLCAVRNVDGEVLLDRDENVRATLSAEKLAALPAAFVEAGAAGGDAVALQRYPQLPAIRHLHTVASAPAMADGAALLLIGSLEMAQRLDMAPRARIRSFAEVAAEPIVMLTAGQRAAERALRSAGLPAAEIGVVEFNESFAAVALKFRRDLELDPERVNVNGGCIAQGHAMGATGAILLGAAIEELERQDREFGLVAISGGAGIGTAMVVQRI